MASFSQRSLKKELLDRDDIPFSDIKRNMAELEVINHRLGGHAITLKGMKKLTGENKVPLSVLEIGCGGGDNLRAIKKWGKSKGIPLKLCGVDINPECIAYARSRDPEFKIEFICSDFRKLDGGYDIIFSSLFCHHFSDTDIVDMLQWKRSHSRIGFFINDLHRHPFAYASILLLTRLFSKSYLVRNDAPLSVLRGFSREEWKKLLRAADLPGVCEWKWAFRWLVSFRHT